MHFFRRQVSAAAVSGENPLKPVIQQAAHGSGLLRPRVPRDIPGGDQRAPAIGPGQMISGEQVFLAIEKYHMTSGMTRHRYRQQIAIELNRVFAIE